MCFFKLSFLMVVPFGWASLAPTRGMWMKKQMLISHPLSTPFPCITCISRLKPSSIFLACFKGFSCSRQVLNDVPPCFRVFFVLLISPSELGKVNCRAVTPLGCSRQHKNTLKQGRLFLHVFLLVSSIYRVFQGIMVSTCIWDVHACRLWCKSYPCFYEKYFR